MVGKRLPQLPAKESAQPNRSTWNRTVLRCGAHECQLQTFLDCSRHLRFLRGARILLLGQKGLAAIHGPFVLRLKFAVSSGLSLGPTIHGISCAQANPRPQYGEEPPQPVLFSDCTTGNAHCLPASDSIRAGADGAANFRASLDRDRILKSVGRNAAQPILAAIFENQLDGGA